MALGKRAWRWRKGAWRGAIVKVARGNTRSVKANPKDFYRYINNLKKDAKGIPPLKKRNGSGVAQSESKKAAEFNGHFTDVFTKSEYSQVPLLDRSPRDNEMHLYKYACHEYDSTLIVYG